MADPTRRKANFLWKFLCAGAACSAMRTPVPHRSPPARIFAEQKCLATDKVSQICCSAGRSSDILQTSKAVHTRKRVLPKYVEDARLGGHCKSGTPGISKGPQPFCFRRSPEETLSRVSSGQFLRGGSTPRFFAQLRSVGSKKNQLAGLCQNHTGHTWPRQEVQKAFGSHF